MKASFKALLVSALTLVSAQLMATEYCTTVIREFQGSYTNDYDIFTSSSYSTDAACSDAMYDCQKKLSDYQSQGYHYSAQCAVRSTSSSYPTYPTYPTYPAPRPVPGPVFPAPRPFPGPVFPAPRPQPFPGPRPVPGPVFPAPRPQPGPGPGFPQPGPGPRPTPGPGPHR